MKKWIQAAGITIGIFGVGGSIAFVLPAEVGAIIVATLLLVTVTAMIRFRL